METFRIGTSGFSYDDWRGFFYPEKTQKSEMLKYYAERFSTVEVNSSYYTIPAPSSFAGMAKKTPEHFDFVVKAHKDITHTSTPDPDVFRRFLSAIEPLREAGKLGCVLAQYPWSFKKSRDSVRQLRQLRAEFGDTPLVIEFRNEGWVGDDTFSFLRDNNIGFCCVDEPQLTGLMPRVVVATSPIGYIRFHGRNAAKWWQHDEAWERYNYLYSPEELSEWVPKAHLVGDGTEKAYLFFNNHYKGKAAQNAQLFAQMLDVQLPSAPDAGRDTSTLFG